MLESQFVVIACLVVVQKAQISQITRGIIPRGKQSVPWNAPGQGRTQYMERK